jgi:anti-sigma B factor antagonist
LQEAALAARTLTDGACDPAFWDSGGAATLVQYRGVPLRRCRAITVLSGRGSGRPDLGVDVSVSDYYRVTLVELDDEAVVEVAGEIDTVAQDRLRHVIDEARSGGRRLVVDLSETTFMDSTGLRVLLEAWRDQTEAGSEMVVRAPSVAMRTLFEITRVGDAIPIEAATDT